MERRRAGGLVLLLCLGTLWFVGSAAPAQACSCAIAEEGVDPETRAHEEADVVIVGRPTQVTHHGDQPINGQNEYAFAVEYVHKGTVETTTAIWTADNGALCGFPLEIGELYKLFAYRLEDGRLQIGLCSGNRRATAADLQPYVPPTTAPPPVTEPIPPPTEPPSTAPPTPPPASATTSSTSSTTTSSTSSTATTSPSSTTTATTEPDDEQAVAIADDEGGGGGGAGWLVALGGGAIAAAVAGGAIIRRRTPYAGDLSPEAAPEP